jgi:5'-methylthioadenosine phosphorylase
MHSNVANSKRLLVAAIESLPEDRPCAAQDALRYAILTPMDQVPEQTRHDLEPLIGRYHTGKS